VDKSLLSEDSEIFVIPSFKDTDEAFIIIDNCASPSNPQSYFFRLFQFNTNPQLHLKWMKNFDRPFNIDNDTNINKLVGYIDMRCTD